MILSPPSACACMLTMVYRDYTIHDDIVDPGRELNRLGECCRVSDKCGIEHDNIRKVSNTQRAAAIQTEHLRWTFCHLCNCLLPLYDL